MLCSPPAFAELSVTFIGVGFVILIVISLGKGRRFSKVVGLALGWVVLSLFTYSKRHPSLDRKSKQLLQIDEYWLKTLCSGHRTAMVRG